MRKALIVGINNYPSSPLFGCVNDATEMKVTLETNSDGGPNFDIDFRLDVQTKDEVMGAVKEIFKGGSEIEIALFYFSGHGYLDELGGYIVTPDATKHSLGISMDDILHLANSSEIRHRIIILDCCNSGAVGSNNSKVSEVKTGVTVLTSCKEDEPAMEINGHGVFTSLLLDALKGGAADIMGNITAGSIYAFIDQSLGARSQRPIFKTNIKNFSSIRSIKPAVQPETLRLIKLYFPSASHKLQLDPEYEYTHPEAKAEKVTIFKNLQKFESVGLVVPDGEEHMYWAAMNGKACKLTALGLHYWRLANTNKI